MDTEYDEYGNPYRSGQCENCGRQSDRLSLTNVPMGENDHDQLWLCEEVCNNPDRRYVRRSAGVHRVIREAQARTATNWAHDGTCIHQGFEVDGSEDSEYEPFWDIGMFAFGSKTAGKTAAFGDAPLSGRCEHCGVTLEEGEDGPTDENGNRECPVADYHSFDEYAGQEDSAEHTASEQCPDCGNPELYADSEPDEDGSYDVSCSRCGWTGRASEDIRGHDDTYDEDQEFERRRDLARGAAKPEAQICDSCGQSEYNAQGVCPTCGYSEEEPEMGPWNSSVHVACPVCRNAVSFIAVGGKYSSEFGQCPKCSSVISYDRLVAITADASDHIQVTAKRPSGWYHVLAELTDADLIEAATMMWERDSDPRYANVAQVMGEIEVEIGKRRLALDEYDDTSEWAEADRPHYVVDAFGDIKSGPYPDFYTAHVVASYDRELRLAVPTDMLDDFEFRVV